MTIDPFDAFLTTLNSEDLLVDVARETARQNPHAGENPPDGYFDGEGT